MSGTRSNAASAGKRSTRGTGGKGGASSGANSGGQGGGKGGGKGGNKKDDSAGFNWWRLLRRVVIIGVVGVLVLAGIVFFAYERTSIPDPNAAYQSNASYVYYSNGTAKVGQYATQNRETVPLAQISKPMQHAIVAAEDRTFWTNKGVDFKSIVRAAFSNAKGNATQGASTITQQYVKFLYLTVAHLSVKQKVKQIFLAVKLQHEVSKQQILAGYLNTIYFGRGAYGVQAAAHAYFNVDASKLDDAQAAMLSSIVNSPNYLNPTGTKTEKAALLARYHYVVNGMTTLGTLDAATADKISTKLPKVTAARADNQYGGQRGFVLALIKSQLLKLGFSEEQIDSGGLRVTTTINRKVMSADQQAFANVAPKKVNKLHVGVASVDVKSGALLGFFGGQDYLKSQINYATTAATSVGSSFKPFALSAAIKQGFSLKSTFDGNSPYRFPDGSLVHNEGEASGMPNGQSYGAHVNLIKALQESINTAFVDMTASMKDGPAAIQKMAYAMGVPKSDKIEANSRIALGQTPIAPVDMANGYSTIANGGVEHPWYAISKVTDSNGKVLWKHKDASHRVMSKGVAADVSYAMQQVVKGGTGAFAANLGRPDAGKTGTATNNAGDVISSWFSGFTPQVSTSVSYSRGNGYKSLVGYLVPYFGANFPTQTWTAAMKAIMNGLAVVNFPPPAYVTGTPPTSGHTYTAPPPAPTKASKPKPTKTAAPTSAPTTAPTQTVAPTTPPPSTAPPTSGGSPTCVPSNVVTC